MTGTPTQSQLFTFDVCVKDGSGTEACQRVYGIIHPAPTPTPTRP